MIFTFYLFFLCLLYIYNYYIKIRDNKEFYTKLNNIEKVQKGINEFSHSPLYNLRIDK